MRKKMKQAWIFMLIISMLIASVAFGDSASSQATTENTSAESSYTFSGASSSGAAMAQTTHTVSEASYATTGGSGSASAYASTPHTTAESTSAGTGSSSASSSYASTTSTTASSSSSSSYVGPAWPCPPVPPAPPVPRRHSPKRYVQVDSIIESEEVTGIGWTTISKVNVRSLASTKASRVRQIRSASTEVMVTAEVLNSAGEKWYGVKLYSGYVGYIRSDLLRVQLDEKETAPAAVSEPISANTNSRKVIYVIVEPVKEEHEIVYITPEQAIEMGLLENDAVNNETPLNG